MKAAWHIIRIIATCVIMIVLWRLIDGQQASEILAAANLTWLIAGFLALSAQTVLSAIRWRLTAGQLGLHLPMRHAVLEYYLSQMINQVLPGGIVGDASRAVRSREQRGLLASSQAVIFERLAGQVVLFVVMTIAVIVTFLVPGGLDWPEWSIPIISMIILGGVTAAVIFALVTLIPSQLRDRVVGLARTMRLALLARRVILAQVTLSLATVLCNLAAFAFCARAVGVVLSPVMVCALVPLILLAMLIPLTVMGWGLREGAAAAFLPLAGATPSEALAASVAFGLTMLVGSAPGMVVIWIRQHPTQMAKEPKL